MNAKKRDDHVLVLGLAGEKGWKRVTVQTKFGPVTASVRDGYEDDVKGALGRMIDGAEREHGTAAVRAMLFPAVPVIVRVAR